MRKIITDGLFIADQAYYCGMDFDDSFDNAMCHHAIVTDEVGYWGFLDASRAYCAC